MDEKAPADEAGFPAFFDRWIEQLEDHLQRLVTCSDDPHHYAAITAHYKAYYAAKWAAAHQDVLPFFAPSWLSPLEVAHQWVTGWKPSTAVRLAESLSRSRFPKTSLAQLGEEGLEKVERLKGKVRVEEERVEREMERLQVSPADWKVAAGGAGEVAVGRLVKGLERVLKAADVVRLKTLKGLFEVLSPKQSVDFLAVFSMVLIQQRKWGKKRRENCGM